MTYKDKIYTILTSTPGLSALEISQKADVGDRTYVSKNLAPLIKEQKVKAVKSGRTVKYFIANTVVALEETLSLKNLREDEIWAKVRTSTTFLQNLSENAENILYFAFTEMLNNAIDHSHSGIGYVKIWSENATLNFLVEDKGIGVFKNVMAKRKLPSESDAARELIKGKLTTKPLYHSGEGIFWTSKIADRFSLTSYNYRLSVNNTINDFTLEKLSLTDRFFGTKVFFSIEKTTKKSLQKLFRNFSFDHQKLTLDTTVIPIKLFDEGDVWISRSQAKKVLVGLEKYKKIIFDFAGINIIGQAFADEIFRVFNIHHPSIILEPIHMTSSVKLMVSHAQNDPTGRSK